MVNVAIDGVFGAVIYGALIVGFKVIDVKELRKQLIKPSSR